ncbi:hypothetical protein [Paenibacillus sp. GXUN7292]|uniref:hypothetical protein n=1 Tax=Paenibacillus sp. GXUN7292 TaxID=3422499 RepID=UPI003D7C3C96
MKFKQSEAQNQRIERITTSHLIVGIDMGQGNSCGTDYELSWDRTDESASII